MQGLTVFVCKIAVLRLPGRIVQAITVDPVGQDCRLFRVCVDCDRKRRRACRCIARGGEGIDIGGLAGQRFRRERVGLIAAGQQRLIFGPAFRVAEVPALLRLFRLRAGRAEPAGERAGIDGSFGASPIHTQLRPECLQIAEAGDEGIEHRRRTGFPGAVLDRITVCHGNGGPVLLCIRRTVQQDLPVGGKRRGSLRQRQRKNWARVGHKICRVRRFDSVAAGCTGKPGIRTGNRAGAKRGNQKERKEQRQDLSDISHRFPSCFL